MTRGRETDEQTLQRIEALFFERYTGPDSVSNGYKEVDNTLYALALGTVPPLMMLLGLVCSLVLCMRSFTETILLLKYHK
jgi:hypothetical protein